MDAATVREVVEQVREKYEEKGKAELKAVKRQPLDCSRCGFAIGWRVRILPTSDSSWLPSRTGARLSGREGCRSAWIIFCHSSPCREEMLAI